MAMQMHMYLIEAGKRKDDGTLLIVASTMEKFENDKQACTYAEFVRNECKYDVVTAWKFVGEIRDGNEGKV